MRPGHTTSINTVTLGVVGAGVGGTHKWVLDTGGDQSNGQFAEMAKSQDEEGWKSFSIPIGEDASVRGVTLSDVQFHVKATADSKASPPGGAFGFSNGNGNGLAASASVLGAGGVLDVSARDFTNGLSVQWWNYRTDKAGRTWERVWVGQEECAHDTMLRSSCPSPVTHPLKSTHSLTHACTHARTHARTH
jgi:hypothetical protein